jgi:hypothetical protein
VKPLSNSPEPENVIPFELLKLLTKVEKVRVTLIASAIQKELHFLVQVKWIMDSL